MSSRAFAVTLLITLVDVEAHRMLHLLLLRPLGRLVRRRQRLLGPRRLHALLPLPRLGLFAESGLSAVIVDRGGFLGEAAEGAE